MHSRAEELDAAGVALQPLNLPVLVLNRVYMPVRITSCRRAVRMICSGTARIVAKDGELIGFDSWLLQPVRPGVDDSLKTVSGTYRVPRIIHLGRYAKTRRPSVRLCRQTLLMRDEHRCQYCGHAAKRSNLDIDHVVPRSRGGQFTWENLVIACMPCNRKKGKQTPAEAGMPLERLPQRPGWALSVRLASVQLASGNGAGYEEWRPFLQAG